MVQFNVDDKKNIFNIKISAVPSEYTKTAQKHFFEIVNNLNGDNILEFPKYSKRKVVTFKEYFIVGTKTQYTRPEDFSDYETVRE